MANHRQREQVRINVESVGRETDKAILVVIDDEDVWIPLSQVHSIHRDGAQPYLMVTPWILKAKGLEPSS